MEQDAEAVAIVFIHGEYWRVTDIADQLAECLASSWEQKQWHPQPAFLEASGKVTQYVGQQYDPAKVVLVADAWDHDHCEICTWKLFATDDLEHSIGYTDGCNWVCAECYNQFLAPGAKLLAA